MGKSFLLFLFTSLFIVACACNKIPADQPENCYQETFEWLVNAFEENDAGFQVVVDKKGENAYKTHTNEIVQKIQTVRDDQQFVKTVNEWLAFFRKGHIYFTRKNTDQVVSERLTDEQIREKYKNESRLDMTESELLQYLGNNKDIDPIEGIWRDGTWRIGVVEDKDAPGSFNAFIIDSDGTYWTRGQIKMTFYKDRDMIYKADIYDFYHNHSTGTVEFMDKDKSVFCVLPYFRELWEKEGVERTPLSLEIHERSVIKRHNKPYIEKLNDQTAYLYVNAFTFENKPLIDSLIKEHDKLLRSIPNLIIDIRNCYGGSDASFSALIPYLYTTPMRMVNVKLRATEHNAQTFEEYGRQQNSRYCFDRAELMRENLGEFILLNNEKPYYVRTYKEVMPYPKRVGIIVRKNNGSTDEQFIMLSKQSFKVKVFGHTTYGAFDASNMSSIETPDGKFILGTTMSLRIGSENFPVDDIGLQPDFFIDPYIPQFEWIQYVQQALEF